MSNFSKDCPSIRVFAPPGGRSNNIFGVPEPEVPMAIKKNHMESDIFGYKKDLTDSAPAKPARSVTNNIFGPDPNQPVQKSNTYSGKNKSTIFDEALPQQPSNKPDRQRSDIFGANELAQSTPTRGVSEKYKSNIFATGDDDVQGKRQPSHRQGLRDPNASRMGYNPINGESYSTKDGLNSKVKQVETIESEKKSDVVVEKPEENGHAQEPTGTAENGSVPVPEDTVENGNSQVSVDKPTNGHSNGTNGHSNEKNSHTSVRVFHPPGGRSHGPLW